MLKKLLILPILGSILGLGAFASANTVDGFTSDSNICSYSLEDTNYFSVGENIDDYCVNSDSQYYLCVSSSDNPYVITYNWDQSTVNVENSYYCYSDPISYGDESFSFSKNISGKFLVSPSSITYSSSSDNGGSDSSLGIPEIPSSFTSGLTSLVNNFGGTIANWLPTIILVALGIYAIFSLFRVVRNYARSSFRG